jgi:hypothetical protein
MAMTNPGFEVVGGTETDPPSPDGFGATRPAPQTPPVATPAQIVMLQLAFKALSQRALVAAMDLFTLITVALGFYLWTVIPDPNDKQIISLSIYALFTLAANWIVRRK